MKTTSSSGSALDDARATRRPSSSLGANLLPPRTRQKAPRDQPIPDSRPRRGAGRRTQRKRRAPHRIAQERSPEGPGPRSLTLPQSRKRRTLTTFRRARDAAAPGQTEPSARVGRHDCVPTVAGAPCRTRAREFRRRTNCALGTTGGPRRRANHSMSGASPKDEDQRCCGRPRDSCSGVTIQKPGAVGIEAPTKTAESPDGGISLGDVGESSARRPLRRSASR
jgi:hypothetical protein